MKTKIAMSCIFVAFNGVAIGSALADEIPVKPVPRKPETASSVSDTQKRVMTIKPGVSPVYKLLQPAMDEVAAKVEEPEKKEVVSDPPSVESTLLSVENGPGPDEPGLDEKLPIEASVGEAISAETKPDTTNAASTPPLNIPASNAAVGTKATLPSVPSNVMRNGVPAPVTSRTASAGNGELMMKPGVNQMIPIALGHTNRIVTPFTSPDVTSSVFSVTNTGEDCGNVCVVIRQNVIYVATSVEYPVTMFVTEKGSQARALSITMLPQKIPPREVFLKLEGVDTAAYGSQKAEAWEKSQPYIETIRTLFRKLALGEVPQGYAMTQIPKEVSLPNCDHPGVKFDFSKGQYLTGHSLSVFVGVAQNTSSQPLEIKEASCGGWNVAAVTTWPLNVLAPNERTEVYIATKRVRAPDKASQRPSLLGGVK